MIPTVWKFFTSLRLTVVCLGLGLLIVFFGTWAQVDLGLWKVQHRWFQSFFVYGKIGFMPWIFPGGYLVGSVTLVNLIAAHIKRFQWSWKKVGIHLAHGGIIILLIGQLLTDQLARESQIGLREGQSRNFSESHRDNELVFATDFDSSREEVVSIPGGMLESKKEITHPKLPFTVRVKEYQPNGELTSRAAMTRTGGQLNAALATLEAEYGTIDALPVQAERASEGGGRVAVWRAAMKAVGQPVKGDLVEAVTKLTKEKPDVAARLLTEVKTRFREEMMTRFAQASPRMRITSTEATAMHAAAQQVSKGAPASPDAFPQVATKGSGPEAIVLPLPEATDMDTRNMPYAVLELIENGASKGTWLVTPWLDYQDVTFGGRTFHMAFRFERYYQPFTVTLLEAKHEVYPGTATMENPEGIPKNFQSRVRITNPEKGEKREADIYMNNPLRYGGLTFYQYQMGNDETASGTPVGNSTLQVVKNAGWVTPYLGCLMVGFGLLYQFLWHLFVFIDRRGTPRPPPLTVPVKKRREAREPQPVP